MMTIIKCLIRLIRIVSSNRNEILYMNFTSLSAAQLRKDKFRGFDFTCGFALGLGT
jgi:hypothetical protein